MTWGRWHSPAGKSSDAARTFVSLPDFPKVATMASKSGTRLRGYGPHHKRLRQIWDARVQAGEVYCARCGRWIEPGTPWDLDHADNDPTRTTYLGPSHAKCNRGAPNRRRVVRTRNSRIW